MKKIICALFIATILIANIASAAGTYVYELEVDIVNPSAVSNIENMILGVEFTASGGAYGTDWSVQIGNAVPAQGNWIFESYGSSEWYALYDDYNYSDPEYAPMESGLALTIFSSVALVFDNLGFYDYAAADVNPDYFSTNGFVEASSVPVPGAIFMLAGGLVTLAGISRRKR